MAALAPEPPLDSLRGDVAVRRRLSRQRGRAACARPGSWRVKSFRRPRGEAGRLITCCVKTTRSCLRPRSAGWPIAPAHESGSCRAVTPRSSPGLLLSLTPWGRSSEPGSRRRDGRIARHLSVERSSLTRSHPPLYSFSFLYYPSCDSDVTEHPQAASP